jgi:hypothetical protein
LLPIIICCLAFIEENCAVLASSNQLSTFGTAHERRPHCLAGGGPQIRSAHKDGYRLDRRWPPRVHPFASPHEQRIATFIMVSFTSQFPRGDTHHETKWNGVSQYMSFSIYEFRYTVSYAFFSHLWVPSFDYSPSIF